MNSWRFLDPFDLATNHQFVAFFSMTGSEAPMDVRALRRLDSLPNGVLPLPPARETSRFRLSGPAALRTVLLQVQRVPFISVREVW